MQKTTECGSESKTLHLLFLSFIFFDQVVRMLLKLLEDKNGEVQNLAVRLVLFIFEQKFKFKFCCNSDEIGMGSASIYRK
jgi:hypothetical protein